MKDATIHVKASELLENGKITVRIEAMQAALRKRHEVTVDRVVQELANIAFANAGDYYAWGPDGVRIKDSAELTAQQRAVVCEVSQTITESGGTIKVKLSDKQAALDKLAKHLGMFIDRKEIGGPGAFDQMDEDQLKEYIDLAAQEVTEIEQALLPAPTPQPKSRKQATKH